MRFSRIVLRSIATSLSMIVFATNVAFVHASETNFWSERQRISRQILLANLPASAQPFAAHNLNDSSIPLRNVLLAPVAASARFPSVGAQNLSLVESLPAAYGAIRAISSGARSADAKTIIHIEDIHLNAEAQDNIGKTIEELINKKKIGLVALEGAFGAIDFSAVRRFPYADANKSVADFLLKDKKISGAMHAALIGGAGVPPVVGVDEREHYFANVDAYKTSAPRIKDAQRAIDAAQSAIAERKRAAFNPQLARFDAQVQSYRRGTFTFGPYVQLLAEHTASVPPAASTFLEAWKAESTLDFKAVEKERTSVIEQLAKRLTPAQTSQFLDASIAYRMGRLRHTDFYHLFRGLCDQTGVKLAQFKAMDAYIRYVLLSESIAPEKLFGDIKRMEQTAYGSVIRSADEKKLIQQSTFAYLAGRLLGFSLTPEEWRDYLALKAERAANPALPDLSSFEAFYREANCRDEAMAANLLKAMDVNKTKVAVLVTGGFHAPGISKRLQDAGATTITFAPNITSVENESETAYLSLFTQEKTPLDKLFQGEKLFVSQLQLAYPAVVLPFDTLAAVQAKAAPALEVLANAPALDPSTLDVHGKHGEVTTRDGVTYTLDWVAGIVRLSLHPRVKKIIFKGGLVTGVLLGMLGFLSQAVAEVPEKLNVGPSLAQISSEAALLSFLSNPIFYLIVGGVVVFVGVFYRAKIRKLIYALLVGATVASPAQAPRFLSAAHAGFRTLVGAFLPFFQLRGERGWGIGDFVDMKEAMILYKELGLNLWQTLPITLSAADNSPYSVASRRLIDPILIGIDAAVEEFRDAGFEVSRADIHRDAVDGKISELRDAPQVRYGEIRELKTTAMKSLWASFKNNPEKRLYQEFLAFRAAQNDLTKNIDRLDDHLLYVTVKDQAIADELRSGVHGTRLRNWDWRRWNEKLRDRDPAALAEAEQRYQEEISFRAFQQFIARRQLDALLKFSRENGVEPVVDIPFALEGDAWIHPTAFGLKKENGYRRLVTQGVPPERAYPAGQYWQFYPYDWSNPATKAFLLAAFREKQELARYIRLDHVLGFYRTYKFIEDSSNKLTLGALKLTDTVTLADEFARLRSEALDAGTDDAKQAAAAQAEKLLKQALLALKNDRSGFEEALPENAISLLFDERGNLRPDNMLLLARAVPENQLGQKLPAESKWQRLGVVEGKVFNDQPDWDFLRVSPSPGAQDAGFMYSYLFDGEPRPADGIRFGYFENAPGEDMMAEFQRLAQREGTTLIWETLGAVPDQAQASQEELGGTGYLPVIWGEKEFWGPNNTNPYHPANHKENAFVTFGLHDSASMRHRWEQELSYEEKVAVLDRVLGANQWSPLDAFVLTSKVRRMLLSLVFLSRSRIAVVTWNDILGLGEEFRPNRPGVQGGQWEAKLPFTIADLRAALANFGPLGAIEAVKLVREIIRISGRNRITVNKEILNVIPEVGGKVRQARRIGGEPFQVDAVGGLQPKTLVIKTGETTIRIPMVRHENVVRHAVPDTVHLWSAEWRPSAVGIYEFHVEVNETGDVTEKGTLVAFSPTAELNKLSKKYHLPETLSQVVESTRKEYDAPTSLLERLAGNFQEQIKRRRDGKDSPLAVIPDPDVVMPDGAETGVSFAASWGGTNAIVTEAVFLGGGRYVEAGRLAEKFSDRHKEHPVEVFDLFADMIYQRLKNNPNRSATVALCAAFPVTNNIAGKLTKGWGNDGVEGKNVIDLMNAAFARRGLPNVRATIVVNDTYNPKALWTYENRGKGLAQRAAVAGAIMGTGTNEAIDIQGAHYNLEAAADDYGDSFHEIQTREDQTIDAYAEVGTHFHEWRTAGVGLGELFRLRIVDARDTSSHFTFSSRIREFNARRGFDTAYLSRILGDNSSKLSTVQALMTELWLQQFVGARLARLAVRFVPFLFLPFFRIPLEERAALKNVARSIVLRSARLLATHYVGIVRESADLNAAVQAGETEPYTIAIEGSVFNLIPGYEQMVKQAVIDLVGADQARLVRLAGVASREGVGAALLALTAGKARPSAFSTEASTPQEAPRRGSISSELLISLAVVAVPLLYVVGPALFALVASAPVASASVLVGTLVAAIAARLAANAPLNRMADDIVRAMRNPADIAGLVRIEKTGVQTVAGVLHGNVQGGFFALNAKQQDYVVRRVVKLLSQGPRRSLSLSEARRRFLQSQGYDFSSMKNVIGNSNLSLDLNVQDPEDAEAARFTINAALHAMAPTAVVTMPAPATKELEEAVLAGLKDSARARVIFVRGNFFADQGKRRRVLNGRAYLSAVAAANVRDVFLATQGEVDIDALTLADFQKNGILKNVVLFVAWLDGLLAFEMKGNVRLQDVDKVASPATFA